LGTVRIAYITHYAELYGANRSLLDLMLELRRQGAVVPHVLLPKEGPLSERLTTEGIPHRVVGWQPWMSERYYMGRLHHRIGQHLRYERAARQRAASNRSALPDLLRILSDWQVEAVHVNSAAVGITGLLLKALRIPLIWHIRELPERQYLLHIDSGRRQYGRALRKATRLIAISKAVQEDIRRYAGNVSSALIYNGVLRTAAYRELAAHAHERWSSDAPFTFLLAGLIHPSKGQEEAIRAFAALQRTHPGTHLVIAGDGRDTHLRKLISELGLEGRVELTGFVKDITPLMLRAHTLLMCSRNEAMGRVTVEGMGSGLPVIGHASGGTLELVQDGRNGLLYPGGVEALAERMAALAGDPAHARALGQQAMCDAAERFSVERYAHEVLDVYRSVLSQAPH
jgi:glycosyltransferase involved in cell wall biosynthesis